MFSNKLKLKRDELWILLFHYLGLLSAMLESAPPRNILALIINYHLQCILVLNLWNPHPDSPSAVDRGAATLWLLT